MTRSNLLRRVALVGLALVVAVVIDLATGYPVPGRMAAFSLVATFVLVLGAKWLSAAGLQQPVGSRVGELGDPADDIDIDDDIDGGRVHRA
ncbi:MAG: hypothetical protein EA389_10830 [Ilumatobacter sp.]|nr:MAG: hypothetical protein EA389_10830 [Ilumatobacter sp.]